jgi:RNA polymerase sigma factor (TIGR02999 family)
MDTAHRTPITSLLIEWRRGSELAGERLLHLVYRELHQIARRRMRNERADHTLQPTALVHEAFVRMVDVEVSWQDRAHFFNLAARIMRRILVDHARAHRRIKRGAGAIKVSLVDPDLIEAVPPTDLLDLDRALQSLQALDDRQSQIVELHYFGGLSYIEIATVMEMSPATVGRYMRHAKAWLHHALTA